MLSDYRPVLPYQLPTTKAESTHTLGPSGLTTPAYELATGTQVLIGPVIGMMFGP